MKTVVMKQTVSVLGGGWFGKPLALQLLNGGNAVNVSSRTDSKKKEFENLGLHHYSVDISREISQNEFFDASVLVVAITSKSIEDFKKLCEVIDASPIKKVVFISSTSVYKEENTTVTETSNLAETELVFIEKQFQKLKNTSYIILRFAGLIGYNRQPSNWFQNKKIPQPNGYVNLVHLDDCLAITHKMITNSIENEIFNVCSNHHPTRKEFYTKAKLSKGFSAPEFIDSETLSYKIVNSDKVQKSLSYQYQFDNLYLLFEM